MVTSAKSTGMDLSTMERQIVADSFGLKNVVPLATWEKYGSVAIAEKLSEICCRLPSNAFWHSAIAMVIVPGLVRTRKRSAVNQIVCSFVQPATPISLN